MTTSITGGAPVNLPSFTASPCCGALPQAVAPAPAGAPPVTGVERQLAWEADYDAIKEEAEAAYARAKAARCWRCRHFVPCPCSCFWGWCRQIEQHMSSEDDPHEGCGLFKEDE